jgi:hypothetical protein
LWSLAMSACGTPAPSLRKAHSDTTFVIWFGVG